MHATFDVNGWVNMKLLNRTQSTNLQLCLNQSTNQPQYLVWGERALKNTFVPNSHICRSVPICTECLLRISVTLCVK